MDTFLDRYQIPKLNQDQKDHLNSAIIPKEKKQSLKLSQTKNHMTRQFKCRIFSDCQRKPNTNAFHKILQNRNRRNTTQLILCSHPYPDSKTTKIPKKKENIRPISLINLNSKVLNKIFATRIQEHIKMITHLGQVDFI